MSALAIGRNVAAATRLIALCCRSKNVVAVPSANLTFHHGRKDKWHRPFPYEKFKYGHIAECFDGTQKRMVDDSRLVIVDGNIGVGKSEFAKKLAEQLDFKFFPEPTMASMYIMPGYEGEIDMRRMSPIMPASYGTCDLETLYTCPDPETGRVAGKIQLWMYHARFIQYCDALEHLFNTGQGVVLDRSVFSDLVMADAFKKHNYMTREGYKYYRTLRDNSICELWRPHLCIYLDAPVSVLRQRITERNRPYEQNSKVLTDEYLQTIEDNYKKDFIPQMKYTTEVMIYDWTEMGDWEMIEDDLDLIDLDPYSKAIYHHDEKFHDWRVDLDGDLCRYRRRISDMNWRLEYLNLAAYPVDAPEVAEDFNDSHTYDEIEYQFLPESRYARGWNPSVGDKWVYLSFLRPLFGGNKAPNKVAKQ